MKNSDSKLLQYSVISACFLAVQKDSEAQAVYTDVDPDIILDSDNESAGIDMNNDEVFDFAFINRTGWFYTSSLFYISYFEVINAGPQSPNNEMAGQIHVISPSYGGSSIYLPYALAYGSLINSDLEFYNEGYQVMAYRYIQTDGDYFPYGGYWYPEVFDRYLGVYFKDTADCYHYGWIRCDVKDNGRTLVIKDYAYEIKCDTGIKAGDVIGDTSVTVEEINTIDAVVYSFDNTIYINLNELYDDVKVSVVDITGKEIYSNSIIKQFTEIPLTQSTGIYFVKIISGNNQFTKKVHLN